MASFDLPWLIGTFVLGALLGTLVASLLAVGRRSHLLQRLSAAESAAAAQHERRRETEAQLAEAESARRALERTLAAGEERLAAAQRAVEEQGRFLAEARRELQDAFRSLAAEALHGSAETFLTLAEQRLGAARSEAKADLDERRQAVETLLEPLRDTLGRLDQRTAALETARVEAYSGLSEQLRRLSLTTGDLQERTSSLATALRGSGTMGRWGEVALRNVAELAGMSEHCDFVEQTAVEGGRRPDMTVRLPGNRWIAVDAKAPLRAYLDAVEATDSQERKRRLDEHVKALRQHVRDLAQRDYASSLPGEVDLVVLFLPGDAFLAAAFQHEPELQVEALRSKVLLATPTTLVALLRTVAIYWQQRSLAEHAEEIAGVARELYDRAAKLGEELDGVGRGLRAALEAYNRAVGSFKHRLLPMSGRLEQLKATEQSRRELTAPEEIDTAPRTVR